MYRTHGKHGTPEYSSWTSMRKRCSNPNNTNWKYYGGRGITVCDRWNSFENFLEDMGTRSPGMSIDRINSSGNYEPDNCRWATRVEQATNKRQVTKLTEFEVSVIVASRGHASVLARIFGILPGSIKYIRRKHGILNWDKSHTLHRRQSRA